MDQMMITVEKNEDIELDYVTWRMTTDHDYLGVITRLVADFMPFKFEVIFGAKKSNKITLVETIKKPLKCKMYHPDYLSEQECLVYDFDVKSIIILYDDTEVFEQHHVVLKINNRSHRPGMNHLGRQLTIKHGTPSSSS